MSRLADLERFYALIDRLSSRLAGKPTLADLRSFRDWPPRGVYYFFEPGEVRQESGRGPADRPRRHARPGDGSRSTLRQRLGQHRGGNTGGGNHRAQSFAC